MAAVGGVARSPRALYAIQLQIPQTQLYSSSELALDSFLALIHYKNACAHQPLISAQKSPDQVTSAIRAWLAVRRPHAATPVVSYSDQRSACMLCASIARAALPVCCVHAVEESREGLSSY